MVLANHFNKNGSSTRLGRAWAVHERRIDFFFHLYEWIALNSHPYFQGIEISLPAPLLGHLVFRHISSGGKIFHYFLPKQNLSLLVFNNLFG